MARYNPITGGGTRRCGPTQTKVNCNIPMDNFWVDYEWLSPSRFGVMGSSRLQTRVLGQDSGTRSVDEQVRSGHDVPAAGTPTAWHAPADHPDTIKTSSSSMDRMPITAAEPPEFRDIPTDGRQRNPRTANLAMYYGNSIGTWEGDTLVIDSINFVDTTWLGRGASSTPAACISSRNSHVLEMNSDTT